MVPGNPSSQVRVPFTGIDAGSPQHTLCASFDVPNTASLSEPGLGAAVLDLLAVAWLASGRRAAATG